ncbi:MAG: prephenate dehydratase [Candidatus Thorarchaeota archaeon]
MEVAYQGEQGAYSEAAVIRIFGSSVHPKPCRHFSDVFREVSNDATKYGVVPVENSIEGNVSQVFDLLLEYDLKVIGELFLRIEHVLIANPGTEIENIKVVYSHPQALGQCRHYLEQHNFEQVTSYDTAGGVKMLKETGLRDAAAIAGERAAEIYKMNILVKDISDTKNNYTRFLVLSKEEVPPSGNDKTSIIFSTKHVSGALHDALGEFATRGINMTKIESRPTKSNLWEYNFYLDFEGHQSEQTCAEALEALKSKTLFVKVLGSYPKGVE